MKGTSQWREDLKTRPWSKRAVIKYTLLQVPAAALLIMIVIAARKWYDLSPWVGWGVVAFWIAKDIVLFPLVWRSYDSRVPDDAMGMVGRQGIAEEPLAPRGYVRVRGELWQAEVARGAPPIAKGEPVRVRKVRGLILKVEPGGDEGTDPGGKFGKQGG